MSFEAINSVVQAENEAKAAVAAAEAKAKQMLSDAQAAGRAAVEAAGDKADSALAELRRKADEEAMAKAAELSRDVENKKAALRARAEARLDRAASLVVERIVKNFMKSGNIDGIIEKDFFGRSTSPFDVKKVILPTDEEMERNPRSRSAKLRIAIKRDDGQ